MSPQSFPENLLLPFLQSLRLLEHDSTLRYMFSSVSAFQHIMMKTFFLCIAIATFTLQTLASPTQPLLAPRQFQANIFFNGVNSNESYVMSFPTTAQPVIISKPPLRNPPLPYNALSYRTSSFTFSFL